MSSQLPRLLRIMATLRDPKHGCKWDLAQNFASIAPYTIEEAYEVADAIEREEWTELKDELGDLLLQVVFHARMAEEAGRFGFEDVARSICEKMERRHPHIFGRRGTFEGAMDERRWEELKAAERQSTGSVSAMDGVAQALPALLRAEKLQKRAARDGFDWPDREGPAEKIGEELQELAEAANDKDRQEEAGDLLFAAVNVARTYGVSPEEALRAANKKFERRYRGMETLAGGKFADMSLDRMEMLWRQVKEDELS